MKTDSDKAFSFGDFELSGAKRTLLKRGEPLALNSKTFDLLLTLVENHGKVLSKDELLDKVWESRFVEENNLTVQISALRKIFGEKKNEHQFIATIPGKGYKFVAEVRLTANENAENLHKNFSLAPISSTNKFETDELIGRAGEITEIVKLFLADEIRFVTLTGAGGSGKTSLAKAVADEMNANLPGEVFFVELAAAGNADLLISTIAQTLDIKEADGKPPFETLADFLRERQTFLVLDNFEQIISAAFLVSKFLAEIPTLKILITSRVALRIKNEREFSVSPLALPPSGAGISFDDLSVNPSIKLFNARAGEAKPSFVLTGENVGAVAEICRRLDGLPLAIELAAARVKLLAPQAILERLANSLKLLTGGGRDLPERQRTMRDTIRWSYDLLEKDERIFFRRLAIFAGGFTVEAAEFVVENGKEFVLEEEKRREEGEEEKKKRAETSRAEEFLSVSSSPLLLFSSSPLLSSSALDLLSSLIDNNLLAAKEQTDGNARLQMLEVVREFAFEMLYETGEIEHLRQIHADYFLMFAEEAETFLHGERGNEWLEKLENDHDNLRAALDWSLKNDGETAARIAAALRFFWLNHAHLSEGFGWSKAALQVTENTVSKARSDLLLSNGVFLRTQGDFEAARKSYEKTLAESRKINDLLQIVKADHGLAAIAVLQKDFTAAQELIEEALDLSRELNDETQTAYSLCSLADLEMSRRNLFAARPLLEECRTLAEKLGNYKLLMTIYFNLGTIEYFENSNETAAFYFTESLRIALEMSNTTMISCLLDGFAGLAAQNGNAEQAAVLSGAAENLRESIGYKIEIAEEIFRDDYLAKTRRALDEKTFAALYEQGKILNSDQAVALIKPKIFQTPDEEYAEIVIETHSISQITIEEEI